MPSSSTVAPTDAPASSAAPVPSPSPVGGRRTRGGPGRGVVLLVAGLCLTVAGVLALARAATSGPPELAQVVAFTPLGVPLAGAALVGALLLVPRRRARAVPVTLAALACVLLAAHLWWQAPLYTGERPGAGRPTFVVATQNYEYGTPSALVDLVDRHDVDVLVLTNTRRERVEQLREAGLATYLPHDDGLGSRTTVLSRFPVRVAGEASTDGVVSTLGLTVPGLGEVDLLAVRPKAPYAPDQWATDWDRVLAHLDVDGSPVSRPTLVVGDLNATLDHAPVQQLERLGMTDAADATNAGWSPTWPADGSRRVLGLRVPALLALDHVMTGGGLVATGFEVDGSVGGDHSAVVATVGPAS